MDLKDLYHTSETFVLQEGRDFYVVVARHLQGEVLGLRLGLVLFRLAHLEWVSICASLCARQRDRTMTPETAEKLFGPFDFGLFEGECLSDGILPLVEMSCSPAELYKVYERMRADLARNLVAQLQEPLARTGGYLAMPGAMLEDMIVTRLDDLIPEVKATCNEIPGFLFVSE